MFEEADLVGFHFIVKVWEEDFVSGINEDIADVLTI